MAVDYFFFFFSSRRRHTRLQGDWSSDVCSSDLVLYHEMLHSVVPDKLLRNGRRRVHTEEFNRRERQFRRYHRARRWEEQNLARFFRLFGTSSALKQITPLFRRVRRRGVTRGGGR